nr:MAG TPA: hypothetical protein [Bacteriophage sp.]
MDLGHYPSFLKVAVIEDGVNNMIIKAEFAELRDIKPGTLISYGGHYYIKSTEVKVDREHVVKSICCDAITGEICYIDLYQSCGVYENANIRLR